MMNCPSCKTELTVDCADIQGVSSWRCIQCKSYWKLEESHHSYVCQSVLLQGDKCTCKPKC